MAFRVSGGSSRKNRTKTLTYVYDDDHREEEEEEEEDEEERDALFYSGQLLIDCGNYC